MHNVSYGTDYEYAATRLSGTIVRIGTQPVYVKDIGHDTGEVYYLSGVGNKTKKCHLDDLDLSPIPLGYINVGRDASYVQRIPSRSYKQGLHGNSLYSKKLHIEMLSVNMFDAIRGLYPKTLEVVEQIMCGEVDENAFSRRFSLSAGAKKVFNLNCRGKTVGTAKLNFGAMNLNYAFNDKFKYLQETLEEDIQNG
jgi:hypothetical protein